MSGFVLYKNHDGWLHWTTAEWWDHPQHNRHAGGRTHHVEYGRYATKEEARDARDLYNQMVHGKPTDNEIYNKALRIKLGDDIGIPEELQ